MKTPAEQCARDLLETVPVLMQFIRDQVRRRRTAGLSLPQFRALAFLSRNQEASLSLAAEQLGLSVPAMSRLVNGLVTGRLVTRQTVAANRRQVALSLTARGQEKLETVRGEIRQQMAALIERLPTGDQKAVARALGALYETFGPSSTVKPAKIRS